MTASSHRRAHRLAAADLRAPCAGWCEESPGRPLLKIFGKAWRDVARHAVDADAQCDSDHRGDDQGVLLNVDLLTAGKLGFELLGQTSSGGEPANKLKPGF